MRVVTFLLALLAAPLPLRAEDVPQAAPRDGMCSVPADEHWKPQEQFVWKQVCLGDEANFNIEQGYGGDLDPKEPAGLPESRVLSSAFLATILLSDKYRRALTSRGVRIIGARFTERVDLQNAELSNDLWLDRSLLENGADLRGLRSTRRITLYGSKIVGPLKMTQIEIRGDFSMGKAEFAALDLSLAHVGGSLILSGSTGAGDLSMAGLQVDGYLFMDDKAKFTQIDLTSARVGALSLSGSQVTGLLNLAELHVDNDLLMDRAEFADVLLGLAHVQGNLTLINSKVTGNLTAYGLRVDGDLSALKAEFAKTNFANAQVRGALQLVGATVAGDLDMTGLRVGRDLLLASLSMRSAVSLLPESLKGAVLNVLGLEMDGDQSAILKATFGAVNLAGAEVNGRLALFAEFAGPVICNFAKVGALNLAGGTFLESMDLTGTQINGELRIGFAPRERTRWGDNSTLYLRNARADAIEDLRDAWPPRIDLSGFAYRNLGGINANQQDPMADRPVSWFMSWLGKQDPYAPAPYEQLATVLRSAGRPGAADQILYAGKERERAQATLPRRAWLTAIDVLIGYGYHMEWALFWVAGFVVTGIAVLRFSGQGPKNLMPFGIAYSFDMLLPIIRLREKHYQIDLQGWPRYYFYVHKIMGYVLASFLIAGLAGITK